MARFSTLPAPDAGAAQPSGRRRGLAGATVLAFESRRASEMEGLIRRHGGLAVVAPSMREVALSENHAVREFLRRLEERETVGPVCSAALRRHGLPPDLEPDHPKMGHLVVAVAHHFGRWREKRPVRRLQLVAPAGVEEP